ncbi:ATP-binding protein [Pseudoprevotella muciniphila]|uniref:ATP-binding protein n=1 Tax=Pseudoprevotella muciniphila TaxID=2133944 RepID=A0A5P8E826_9BACT|nr:ATP-binding protein [Pseudoprevotella muciniphila]QFQ13040.1 ATP-binding protein [Pseudoprevotella muciniphila]
MKTILFNQKKERDELMSRPYLIRRTKLDARLLLGSNLIKLITGPRRVGKSTQALLMLRNTNFAYLNFDSQALLESWNSNLVMRMLDDVYPDYDYILLDEVQNLDGWDLWISELYREGKNLIITGSNAKMLSSEMATALTGKYLQVEMLPFSLEEFFDWNGLNLKELGSEQTTERAVLIDDYLRNGGYPEVVKARQLTRTYLDTLFDSIVWKDVAKRHHVRNVSDLNNLALYFVSNFCNAVSANELTRELGFSSVNTTKKYMDYLHEPFMFYYLYRYNNKLRLMKKASRKVYVVDNGFVAAKAFSLSENLGRLLENQVFIELLRRGYDSEKSIFYYRSRNDKEVDFVLRDGARIERLVQVCYDMSSPKTQKRETDSLVECAEELNCRNLVIVTNAEKRTIEKDGYKIVVVPVFDF